MSSSSDREAIISKLSQRLREERMSQGLSLAELARRAGLSHTMVMRMEKGERLPTIDTLLRITEALGCELGRLITESRRSIGQ